MVKKKNKNIILIVFLIILGLFLLIQFNVFDFKGLSVVTLDSGKTANNIPYVCPSEASECNVKGIMECKTPSGNVGNVIFRTNARTFSDYDSGSTWIAINCIPSGSSCTQTSNLNGYCNSGIVEGGSAPIVRYTPTNNIIQVYNSKLKILARYQDTAQTKPVYEIYSPCSTADLTAFPKEPYKSNNQEVTNGTSNAYTCNGLFKVESGGSTVFSQALSGSQSTPFTKEIIKTILPNQKASVSGGSGNFIEYTAYRLPECSVSQCVGSTGYKQCSNGELSDTLITCQDDLGEVCLDSSQGAFCKPKYILDSFKFRDSLNTKDVLAYTPSETVSLKLKFTSSLTNSINTKIKVYKDDNQVYETSKSLIPNEFNFITLTSLTNPGSYYVVLEITDGNKVIPFGRGRDLIFSITATDIQSNFKFSTKLIDEQTNAEFTSTKLYTNNPIEIEYRTFESGNSDNLVSPDTYNIKATLNGQPITLPQPTQSIGLIRYSLTLTQPGLLRFEGTSTRAGRVSNLASLESQVTIPEVKVKYLNAENLVSLKPGSTKNIEFETRSAIGNLVSSTNVVRVIVTGGTEQSITNIQGENGLYNFDYTFGKVGDNPSAYQFFITSSSANHQTSSRTQSPLINVASQNDEIIKECTSDSQCSTGQTCNLSKNKCEATGGGTNYILYLVIGIAVLLVLILIIFLIRSRRKKQTTFSL